MACGCGCGGVIGSVQDSPDIMDGPVMATIPTPCECDKKKLPFPMLLLLLASVIVGMLLSKR